ncbi:MAG: hypothetical protein OEW18_07630 [Candidatus Aminicenantes bacterium]|nr:hypothetical protein [Candidatus Aminicenantes bacterium]
MRNLILIVVLLLLLAFFLILCASPAPAAQESDPFIGVWKGSLAVAGVTLDFTVTFSRDDKSQMVGTIDIPAQDAAGVSLGKIKVEGRKISFIIDNPGAQGDPTFKGELDETGKKVSGSFIQSGYEGTFSMDRQAS